MKIMDKNITGIKERVIVETIELAKKHDINKIYLYGSRARGDYKERSDIDLAITGGSTNNFILDLDEDISTLLMFDVVNLDCAVQEDLLNSIKKEGVLIYEKTWKLYPSSKKLRRHL